MPEESGLVTRPAPAPLDLTWPLSARELEVLEKASRGFTNGHIAEEMNVTIHAVKWHLASIYRKLGVSNRTEAAIAYLKEMSDAGLVDSKG